MTDRASSLTRRRWLSRLAVTGMTAGIAGCGGADDGGDDAGHADETAATETAESPVHADYETTVVRVETQGGDVLGEVTAAIADTPSLRFTGLSETERLPEDRGMLFVYESVADRTFVMRGMDFGIDVVYADGDGTITRIHHAPEPGPGEDGSQQEYPGRGRYVLEVVYEWTTERGVSTGDVLRFDR